MKYFICFIGLIFPLYSYGQELHIEGCIVDSSGLVLQNIHVLNVTSQKGTTTNAEGDFYIPVQINDTLIISSVQYLNSIRVIKEKDLGKPINVVLKRNVRLLSDVVLSPRKLFLDTSTIYSGDIEMSLPFDNTSVKRPYVERRYDVLKPKVEFYGIGVAASVLGSFTKEYKDIKELKNLKKEDEITQSLYRVFNESFYTQSLEIPKDKIRLFIDYCLGKDLSLNLLVERNEIYLLIEHLKPIE